MNVQYPTWSSKAATNFATTEHTEHTEKDWPRNTQTTPVIRPWYPSWLTGQSTKKTIVNFLLRKNLTIDFVKNVQKKQEYDGLYYGISNVQVKIFLDSIPTCLRESHRQMEIGNWVLRRGVVPYEAWLDIGCSNFEIPIPLIKNAGKGAGVPTLKFLNVNLQDIANRLL